MPSNWRRRWKASLIGGHVSPYIYRGIRRNRPARPSFRGTSLILAGLLATAIQWSHGAETPTLIDRSNADLGPTKVSVAMWIVDISSINSAEQTFSADVFIALRWKDPRLAHTSGGAAQYALDAIWNPRVAIVNETNSVSRRRPETVEVDPDGNVLYRQRFVGSFSQALRLKSFPFDQQDFRVQLAALRYGGDEVNFVPEQKWVDAGMKQGGGLSKSIILPDWTLKGWNIRPLAYAPVPDLANSGYVLEFTASRDVQHYILKVILPLVLVVMMSWAVFWIDPTNAGSQISVAVTSMLTLIAYRFAVDSQLPRLPYMTRLDAFIAVSSLLIFISLIQVLITTNLAGKQRVERARKIDRYCRAIFPLLFATVSVAIFLKPRT